MATITKSQAARLERYVANVDTARSAIFASVLKNDVPFNECVKLAPLSLVKAYGETIDAKIEFEARLIAEGRGYRSAYGSFNPH